MNIWIFLLIFSIIYTSLKVAHYEYFEYKTQNPLENNEKKSKYTIKELSVASNIALQHAKSHFKTDRIAMLSISDTIVNHKYITFKCKLYNYKNLKIINVHIGILKPFFGNKNYSIDKFEEIVPETSVKLESHDTFAQRTWHYDIEPI